MQHGARLVFKIILVSWILFLQHSADFTEFPDETAQPAPCHGLRSLKELF